MGAYESLDAAAKAMCPMGVRAVPNPEVQPYYERRYALYKKAIACLDGLWDDMQACIEGR